MPQYQVLRPIERNGRLYLPGGHNSSEKVPSAGHGGAITVDTSGLIVLSESEAAAFDAQQIRPLPPAPAGPTPIPEHAVSGTGATAAAEINPTPAQPAGPTPIPETAKGTPARGQGKKTA